MAEESNLSSIVAATITLNSIAGLAFPEYGAALANGMFEYAAAGFDNTSNFQGMYPGDLLIEFNQIAARQNDLSLYFATRVGTMLSALVAGTVVSMSAATINVATKKVYNFVTHGKEY